MKRRKIAVGPRTNAAAMAALFLVVPGMIEASSWSGQSASSRVFWSALLALGAGFVYVFHIAFARLKTGGGG